MMRGFLQAHCGGDVKLGSYFSFLLIFTTCTTCFIVSAVWCAAQSSTSTPNLSQLEQMIARFAPTPLRVDTSKLSVADRQALTKMLEASRILNDIFMKQYWSGDVALYQRLQKDTTPLGQARLHYFWINKGPWSEIDDYKAFVPGVPPRKPEGANFYPEDMTKEQFETWVASLPKEQQEEAKGFFTVIRSKTAGKELMFVPYSEEYKDDLTRAAALLKEAAWLTDNASLKRFLNLRADAFLSNDYYESDLAWLDLDAPLDITIGPYETNPRFELKELYSAIEEAKADVTGLFALQYMMDHSKQMGLDKILPSDEVAQRQLYTTYLASAFRSLRFGLNDAHGKGMAVQFNFLVDHGAFVEQKDGTFSVDVAKMKHAVIDLDHDLLTLEAEGDYAAGKKMLADLGVIRPSLKKALDSLQGIPTDIEPIFVTAEELAPTSKQTAAPETPKKTSTKRRSRRG